MYVFIYLGNVHFRPTSEGPHVLKVLRNVKKEDDAGFTLIELLVVVLIIGVLAAIAIPVFLNQITRARVSEVQTDLRNAAVVMETERTAEGTFAGATTDDFVTSDGVTLTIVSADSDSYCIDGDHADLDETWSISSDRDPQLAEQPCGGTT